MITSSDLQDIKPAASVSDKYSINLYRFLHKNKHCRNVYSLQECLITGVQKSFSFNNPHMGDIYIGRHDQDQWFSGKRLANILNGGKGYTECFAYAPNYTKNIIDITDWFYKEYARVGRALWDVKGHVRMLNDESRWTAVGNTRRCNWSGRWYSKKVVKEQTTRRADEWVIA